MCRPRQSQGRKGDRSGGRWGQPGDARVPGPDLAAMVTCRGAGGHVCQRIDLRGQFVAPMLTGRRPAGTSVKPHRTRQ